MLVAPFAIYWGVWCRRLNPRGEAYSRCERRRGHPGACSNGGQRWFVCVGCRIPTWSAKRVCEHCEALS
jgi:hypothetical protein